ncbi:putative serine/threonine-protein kinase [Podospora australis]|uniref:non-specific serine/threonine protein kinase n=1 Tax=Podospora australis TaxID=1536484 RepID=A0AAN6WY19_9PEZI|nr:putative serine/threonine-protein kinase [Podospora australis]
MASFGQAAVPPATVRAPAPFAAAVVGSVPGAPAGTFSPGTKIQVGNHRVVIQKYLSEGGFAHVYLVKLAAPVNGTDQAVLKRVAVPDKESLRGMRTEVETMKRLKGHKAIVTYIDSHASELRGGGYEVFLLMEFCNGGGLIDFMNTRLQHRLTEPEILNIFADVAEGVACMHYLRPPLLHRDLKVENVLITMVGSVRKFKLCDFGSAAAPRPAPTTVVECRLMDEDVQKHTTMQYRSPEMIDVYRKQPIDEKSDIWALGVLLYKLCYYTTPFEDQGQLAILNASYKFPSYPAFSDRLKGLIAWMLRENQQSRPNIYQVLREACAMQGREPPVKDIYAGGKAQGDPHQHKQSMSEQTVRSPPMVGAVFSPKVTQEQQVIPEVERMRRGRVPVVPPATQARKANPSPPKVTSGDPFAALDARSTIKSADDISSRFPSLDQFSLLHDHGTKFEFSEATSPQLPKDLSQRVAEKLADDAFQVKPSSSPVPPAQSSQRQSVEINRAGTYPKPTSDLLPVSPPLKSASAPPKQPVGSLASAIISNSPELQAISSQASQPAFQPTSRPTMVSTGTMTSPSPPEAPYQVYRFPPNSDRHRAASLPRSPTGPTLPDVALARTEARTPSYHGPLQSSHIRQPSSSRPSLEGGRPSFENLSLERPSSRLASRPRPISTHLESNLDFLREKEGQASPRFSLDRSRPGTPKLDAENPISSNVDYLRSLEESEPGKKEKTSKHHKRGSLSSLGAGAKNILAGKFGDAFKRFETNTSGPPPLRTPSPLKDLERHDLTPIAGSVATDNWSDDGRDRPEEELTPEMRREKEAQMLAQEEARVAAAQAEYRQRVAQRGSAPTPLPKSIGGVSRATSIQNKVQSLLDESNKSTTNVTRTAQGYGQYSDAAHTTVRPSTSEDDKPYVPRKPASITSPAATTQRPPTSSGAVLVERTSTANLPGGARPPTAPPKPGHLNRNLTNGGLPQRPPSPVKPSTVINPTKRGAAAGSTMTVGSEALLAVDLPGGGGSALLNMTAAERDDYIQDFQKRFPSLGAIEMVERDLGAEEYGSERPGTGATRP